MTVIILVVGTFRLSFTFFISETQPQYFTMSIQITGNIGHAKTKEEDKQNNITQHRKL
jgi:hypothetical protein